MKKIFKKVLLPFVAIAILTASMLSTINACNTIVKGKNYRWYNTYYSSTKKVRVVDISFNGDYLDDNYSHCLAGAITRWNDNSEKRVAMFYTSYKQARLQLAGMAQKPIWVKDGVMGFANLADKNGKWLKSMKTGDLNPSIGTEIYYGAVYTMPKTNYPWKTGENKTRLLEPV